MASTGHRHALIRSPSFLLSSGASILDFELSYATVGRLNDDTSNVVLALTSLGSTHHRLDYLMQPGRALDPERWFVIAVDAIGNGRTSSPSTSRRQPGEEFPQFSISDMVNSQIWLLDELAIDRVRVVVGASMGGMQALVWAKAAPARIDSVVAMTPLVRTPPWTVAVNTLARFLLTAEMRGLDGGKAHALALMELLACGTPEGLEAVASGRDAVGAIASLVDERRGRPFSPIDWIYQSRAYDRHDLGVDDPRKLPAILQSIATPSLVIVPPVDLFNPVAWARLAVKHMPNARLVTIPSERGHMVTDGRVSGEAEAIDLAIRTFLSDHRPPGSPPGRGSINPLRLEPDAP